MSHNSTICMVGVSKHTDKMIHCMLEDPDRLHNIAVTQSEDPPSTQTKTAQPPAQAELSLVGEQDLIASYSSSSLLSVSALLGVDKNDDDTDDEKM